MVNVDELRERIRERLEEGDDDAHCPSCHVMLTSTDREDAAACTNCGAALIDDEGADEDLWEVADYTDGSAMTMATKMTELNTITLEPAWYRCKLDGLEFRALTGQPKCCPTCKSTDTEIVVEVAPELSAQKHGGEVGG